MEGIGGRRYITKSRGRGRVLDREGVEVTRPTVSTCG